MERARNALPLLSGVLVSLLAISAPQLLVLLNVSPVWVRRDCASSARLAMASHNQMELAPHAR